MQNPFFKQYTRMPLSVTVRNTYKEVEKCGIVISPQTLDHIADKADRVPHSEKKNPVAFLLGFHVVEDNKIVKARLMRIQKCLDKLAVPLTVEDIIRYAQLIIK